MIIFSILLAFGLNNWSESIRDQRRSMHLVVKLDSELKSFQNLIAQSKEFNKIAAARLDSLLNDEIKIHELEYANLRKLFGNTVSHAYLGLDLRTMENAVSASGSELIQNEKLKVRLYEFQRMINFIQINNGYLIDYWNDKITPYLISSGYMIEFQRLASGRKLDADKLKSILSDSKYLNVIAGKSILQRDFGGIQGSFEEKTIEIVEMLEETYDL